MSIAALARVRTASASRTSERGPGTRAPDRVLLLAAAAAAIAFVVRNHLVVTPYLAVSAGDLGHYQEGARAILQGDNPLGWMPYPPLSLLLFAPLGALTLGAAREVWFLASELALVA